MKSRPFSAQSKNSQRKVISNTNPWKNRGRRGKHGKTNRGVIIKNNPTVSPRWPESNLPPSSLAYIISTNSFSSDLSHDNTIQPNENPWFVLSLNLSPPLLNLLLTQLTPLLPLFLYPLFFPREPNRAIAVNVNGEY